MRRQRKHETRKPRANSYLIVTEGTKTEPNYFNGLKEMIEKRVGGNVNVVSVPQIDVEGKGVSTRRLLEKTRMLVKNAKILYQNIWVVFDKDEFVDFDEAIRQGEKCGYNVAWSNQSFEYWLFLHFQYSDAALHRKDWERKLSEVFKLKGVGKPYDKNVEDIFDVVTTYGSIKVAISNANRRMSQYEKSGLLPSEFDPGTKVHILVDDLMSYL